MKQKRPPGPVGTSCLTCKRRRKKCDQGRPVCERCIEGGYDCLGYDHIQRRTLGPDKERSPSHCDSRSEASYSTGPSPALSGFRNESDNASFGQDCSQSSMLSSLPLEVSTHEISIPSPDSPLDSHDHGVSFNTPTDNFTRFSVANSRQTLAVVNSQPWNIVVPFTPRPPALYEFEAHPETQSNLTSTYNGSSFGSLIEPLATRNLSHMPPDVRQLVNHVITLYERVLDVVCFRPQRQQIIRIRETVIARLQESSITRCAASIGAKLIESLLDRTTPNNRVVLTKSIERLEQLIHAISAKRGTPHEVQDCLEGFLKAVFLKMRIHNSFNTYQLLRNSAPTFLQIVYTDSTLWPNPHGPPAVSLPYVLSSTRYELGHFVMIDILCSMAYGLPQVVDYDTSASASRAIIHPIEWVHGCPSEFLYCLADMNFRCANNYIAHDWHLIERRLLSFKPSLFQMEALESWKTVARLAVIESWRQVLLIYLYMAVCGVTSDDVRVQSAVRQVFQLFGTVRRQDPPKINADFMFHYIIAGACTRSEKQRAYVRERLLDSYDNECWLLQGSEFVLVLDHLWHGAAANGRAIKWSDYITSRQAALPILI